MEQKEKGRERKMSEKMEKKRGERKTCPRKQKA